MAKQVFDQPNLCNPILPYDPVTNRLSFFRITVFDAELPLKVQFPHHAGNKHPVMSSYELVTDPRRVVMGLPIADLFPDLLPEAPSVFYQGSKEQFRFGSNQTFLPAARLNRRYSDARLVSLPAEGAGASTPDAPGLDADELATLASGAPVTRIVKDQIERFRRESVPAATASAPSSSSASAFSMTRAGAPPANPAALDDATFIEVMSLLFDGTPSVRFHLNDLTQQGIEGFRELYSKDPRADQYLANSWRLTPSREGRARSSFPTYEIGLISVFEQTWSLTGYSRGGLVSAITLAPNEELTIEVFTWDRSKIEEQREITSEYERNLEVSSLTKVTGEVSRNLSETVDRNAGIGVGVSLPVQGVPVNIDGSADVAESIQEGIETSVSTISEATTRASERFKTTNQIKVVQTRESGREDRVTRRIRNPNLGRTMNVNCFEVVEHYNIRTRLARPADEAPRFVLLVELPRSKTFDVEYVLAFEDKLKRSLLSSVYTGGFDAAKRLLAQRFFDQRALLKLEIEDAQSKARAEQAGEEHVDPIVAVATSIKKIVDTLRKLDLIKEVRTLADSYLPGGASISASERASAHEALGRFNFWLKFRAVNPGVESKAIQLAKDVPKSPSAQQSYAALQAFTAGLDDEWLTSVKMMAANAVAIQLGATLLIPFPWLAPVMLELALVENNMGLPALIEKAKKEVRRYEMAASVPAATAAPAASATGPLPVSLAPPQLYTLAELSEADAEFRKLQLHLEANAVYYLNFITSQEDANVRYEKLKSMGLHRFVTNVLLGFVGGKAVFPLRMETLEESTRQHLQRKLLAGWADSRGKITVPDVKPADTSISMPTGGLYMEASLGQCDALEPFLQESRAAELAVAESQAALARERVKQMVLETQRLEKKLAAGDLDP